MFGFGRTKKLEYKVERLEKKLYELSLRLESAAFVRIYTDCVMHGYQEVSVSDAVQVLNAQLGLELKVVRQPHVMISLEKTDASRPEAAVS